MPYKEFRCFVKLCCGSVVLLLRFLSLAAIGEKEWYFYVPRDRKYRNGDRPNRVTTTGYWKATGADRTIKTENFRTIGLKKTLVFYSGKAPKGVRSSWIMNEYRLPQHETERLQTVEISLCRVYKRAVMEDHSSLPRSLSSRASSSSSSRTSFKKNKNDPPNQESTMKIFQTYNATNPNQVNDKQTSHQTHESSNTDDVLTSLALTQHNSHNLSLVPLSNSTIHTPEYSNRNSIFPNPSFVSSHVTDDLHTLVNFQSGFINHHHHYNNNNNNNNGNSNNSSNPLSLSMLPGTFQAALSDRIWDWSSVPDTNKDFHNIFK